MIKSIVRGYWSNVCSFDWVNIISLPARRSTSKTACYVQCGGKGGGMGGFKIFKYDGSCPNLPKKNRVHYMPDSVFDK